MWHFSREEGRSVPREIAPVCARQSEGLRYSDLTLREKFLGVVEVVAGHWMWDDVGSNPWGTAVTGTNSSQKLIKQHCRALQPWTSHPLCPLSSWRRCWLLCCREPEVEPKTAVTDPPANHAATYSSGCHCHGWKDVRPHMQPQWRLGHKWPQVAAHQVQVQVLC